MVELVWKMINSTIFILSISLYFFFECSHDGGQYAFFQAIVIVQVVFPIEQIKQNLIAVEIIARWRKMFDQQLFKIVPFFFNIRMIINKVIDSV